MVLESCRMNTMRCHLREFWQERNMNTTSNRNKTLAFNINHRQKMRLNYPTNKCGDRVPAEEKEVVKSWKKKTYVEYRHSHEEMWEILTTKANVDRLLKMGIEQDAEKEKDHDQR